MGLIETIRQDINSILTNPNDFGVTLILQAPTSPVTVLTTIGTQKKHHLTLDEFGMPKANKGNVINATCTVSIIALDDAEYPYKISNSVSFKGHLVTMNGVQYIVEQWYPDDAGLIVLILGNYGTD